MKFCLIVLLLISCTRLKNVPSKDLELRDLRGHWTSENNSWLNISCSGAMSYEIISYYFPFFWEPYKNTGSGDYISEIHEDHFRVEPFGQKYKIGKWPYQDGKVVRMVVDGRTWTRKSEESCNK